MKLRHLLLPLLLLASSAAAQTVIQWSKVTGRPTTAAGYGITSGAALDALAAAQSGTAQNVAAGAPVSFGTVTTTQKFASDSHTAWTTLTATGMRALAQTAWGAVLGGYGTTNDVSLLNRAGALALGIPANTTDVELSGRLGVVRPAGAAQQAAIFANNYVGGAATTSLVLGTRTLTGAAAGTEGISLRATHDFASNIGAGWVFTTRTTGGVEQDALTLATNRDATLAANLTVSGVYVSNGLAAFQRTGMNGQSAHTVLNLTSDAQSAGDAPGLAFNARDSGAAAQSYATILAHILDPTATSEAAELRLYATTAGSSSTLAATFSGTAASVSGSFAIGGGSTLTKVLTAAGTLDFASLAAAASADLTLTVTGATVGQSVALGLPTAPAAGVVFTAYVSATNTVTVRATNITGTPVDPASATYRATVLSF